MPDVAHKQPRDTRVLDPFETPRPKRGNRKGRSMMQRRTPVTFRGRPVRRNAGMVLPVSGSSGYMIGYRRRRR